MSDFQDLSDCYVQNRHGALKPRKVAITKQQIFIMVEDKHATKSSLRVAIQESLLKAHAVNDAALALHIDPEDSKQAKPETE